jgi:hypothetical protein
VKHQRDAFSPEILSGWKDIASHLGKGVRTVQRYERQLSLPVHRPNGGLHGAVIATKPELDAWVTASPVRAAVHHAQPLVDNATLLNDLRQHLKELRRLREEAKNLRKELHVSLEHLRTGLVSFLPERPPIACSGRPFPIDLLTFHPDKKTN